jgi:hypothetical protein
VMFSDTDRAGIYIEYNNPLVKFTYWIIGFKGW